MYNCMPLGRTSYMVTVIVNTAEHCIIVPYCNSHTVIVVPVVSMIISRESNLFDKIITYGIFPSRMRL